MNEMSKKDKMRGLCDTSIGLSSEIFNASIRHFLINIVVETFALSEN